jgi:hypothetical protein
MVNVSVADLDPDPYVFGPPGSRYGNGSFYHQAKKVRKTFISTVFTSLIINDFYL